MPEEISSLFLSAGIQLAFYCLGRLVHNLTLYLEDREANDILCKAFAFVSICLYIAGFFVSIAIGLLNQYPNNRARLLSEESAKKEEHDVMERICAERIRQAVYAEHVRCVQLFHPSPSSHDITRPIPPSSPAQSTHDGDFDAALDITLEQETLDDVSMLDIDPLR